MHRLTRAAGCCAVLIASCASTDATDQAGVVSRATEPASASSLITSSTTPRATGTTSSAETTTIWSTTSAPAEAAAASTSTVATTTAPDDPLVCVASLPLEWRAGQVLMPAIWDGDVSAAAGALEAAAIGGVIAMSWPAGVGPDALLDLKMSANVPLIVATDEEGGRVQRFRFLGELPSARFVAGSMSPDQAETMVAAHAATLNDFGIDVVFGPVADVGYAEPIGDRAFSDDPTVVSAYVQAYVRGWQSAGITPVLKHFPGHGGASADVFLRGELGYHSALVFTDALEMGAIEGRFALPEASVMAISAGADVAVFTDTSATVDVRNAIVRAVGEGRLGEGRLNEAVQRILAHKGSDPCMIST